MVATRVEDLLAEARLALNASREELEEFRRSGAQLKLRDAAEKAWIAANKAIEALLASRGVEAKTYREKRDWLEKLGYDVLRDRFMARARGLHIDCFYEGLCDDEFVEEEIRKVEDIIDFVEREVKGHRQ